MAISISISLLKRTEDYYNGTIPNSKTSNIENEISI